MPDRNSKQCRERWYNHLDAGLKKGEWTIGEDKLILTTQSLYGNQWATISKLLKGRTDSSIKNRFLVLQRHIGKSDDASPTSNSINNSKVNITKPKRTYKNKSNDNVNDSPTKSERNFLSSSLGTDISNEHNNNYDSQSIGSYESDDNDAQIKSARSSLFSTPKSYDLCKDEILDPSKSTVTAESTTYINPTKQDKIDLVEQEMLDLLASDMNHMQFNSIDRV